MIERNLRHVRTTLYSPAVQVTNEVGCGDGDRVFAIVETSATTTLRDKLDWTLSAKWLATCVSIKVATSLDEVARLTWES